METGERVMIGGFIITGSQTKDVILRGLGPSVTAPDPLSDPTLQLFNADGVIISANDNWRDRQETEILESGIAPPTEFESALIATLAPGNYTAVLQGKNNTSGVGLFEAYDFDRDAPSQIVNLSTRGFVSTDNNVLIGGFILDSRTRSAGTYVIRALGRSLEAAGLTNTLHDPQLELYAGSALLGKNDDWQDDSTQASLLISLGLNPRDAAESAIITTLLPGAYTALLRGANNTVGLGLVEIYNITPVQ